MQQTLTKTNEVDKLVKQTVLDMGYSSKKGKPPNIVRKESMQHVSRSGIG